MPKDQHYPSENRYRLGSILICCSCGTTNNLHLNIVCNDCSHRFCQACKRFEDPAGHINSQTDRWVERRLLSYTFKPPRLPDPSSFFQDPESYRRIHQDIKAAVFEISIFQPLAKSLRASPDHPNARSMGVDLGDGVLRVLGSHHKLFHNFQGLEKVSAFFHEMLEYHRSLAWICLMVIYLQETKMIQDQLSLLVMVSPSTVTLQALKIQQISILATYLDEGLQRWYRMVTLHGARKHLELVVAACDDVLRTLHCFVPHDFSKLDDAGLKVHLARTISILELAIILHCQGHTTLSEFPTANDFPLVGDVGLTSGELCRAAPLACLSPFFDQQPLWIIQTRDFTRSSSGSPSPDPLALLTTIDTFNEVWGPVWKVEEQNEIFQYNAGLGSVVPWRSKKCEKALSIGYGTNTRTCHWMPYNLMEKAAECDMRSVIRVHDQAEENVDEAETSGSEEDSASASSANSADCIPVVEELDDIAGIYDLIDKPDNQSLQQWAQYARENPLAPDDLLLIGADTCLRWSECHCSAARFRKRRRNSDSLQPLGARESAAHAEKGTFGLAAGYQGVSLKQDFTIHRTHRHYKEWLLTRWEHYRDSCNPEQLKVFGGVLVSLCTRNAIRCSILDLLQTPSMNKLLSCFRENCKASMPEECWKALLEADVERLARSWKLDADCQRNIGDIILKCLKHLQHTGFDRVRSEFNALWVYQDRGEPERIALKASWHNWVQALQDAQYSCAMAVLVETCFGVANREGIEQFCGHRKKKGRLPSRLETALRVNSRHPPFDQTKVAKRHGGYDVSAIEPGTHIKIVAPYYRLTVVESLSKHHLLLEWDTSWKQGVRNMLSFGPATHEGHSELFKSEDEETTPVIMHVQHGEGKVNQMAARMVL